MQKNNYKNQVQLLLQVLPYVASETVFALHGGTAINLFHKNMPRLSVDIDLTFTETIPRIEAINQINKSLTNIKNKFNIINKNCVITHQSKELKLIITKENITIKIEVNNINRGLIAPIITKELCNNAQQEFDTYCEINIVSDAQLFGGKICASLDRQHPRDIFDLQEIANNIELFTTYKKGIMYALLSSKRPIHELLKPNLIDQSKVFEEQFVGMAKIDFTYQLFEIYRLQIIDSVNKCFNNQDKQFIIDFHNFKANLNLYSFENLPSLVWKLKNLQKLKLENMEKYNKELLFTKNALL
jgi:Nucleotidyl transferase AbiEii toxin, Type IV TA system